MIDLRIAGRPPPPRGGPRLVPVETNFRAWIAFDHELSESGAASRCIFPDRRGPKGVEWVPAAIGFLESRNETPNYRDAGEGARVVDYVSDGEYIVASFMQAYGIDLTDPGLEMHWHLFKALFGGLPADTKMARIVAWRAWRGEDRRKPSQIAEEQRAAWKLPDARDERYAALQQSVFGDIDFDIPEFKAKGV